MSIVLGQIFQAPSGSPPVTNGGDFWYQTDTGVWLVGNSSSSWTTMGSGEFPGFGMMALSGGPFSGAPTVTGTNLMTADGSTAFTVPPTVTTKDSTIASMADVSALQATVMTLIANTVAQAVGNIPIPGLNNSIAFGFGTAGPAATYNTNISLAPNGMTYADGTLVQLADCYGFASINISETATAAPDNLLINKDYVRGMTWQCYNAYAGPTYTPGLINYMIIAIKNLAT
jgi:hypothetical protein